MIIKREKNLNFRCSNEELEMIKQKADLYKMSTSEYIRVAAINGVLPNTTSDLQRKIDIIEQRLDALK